MGEIKKVDVSLSVIQWNVIIGSIKPLGFFETDEILKEIDEQAGKSSAKGHEEITVKLSENQVKKLISFLQFMPYNVVARIIFTLYTLINDETKTQNKEVKVEVKVEE